MALWGSGEYDGSVPSEGIARHLRQQPKLAAEWKRREYWTDEDLRAHARRAIMQRRHTPAFWIRRIKETLSRWRKSH